MAKFKIKGEKKVPGYDDPDIEVDVDDKYEAYPKPIPQGQTPYKGFLITWFNNFGVREKPKKSGGMPGPDANVFYKVKLKKLPEGKRLFALYKDPDDIVRVHKFEIAPDGPGNVKFTLNVGDPPLGVGP